ncbi:MAG: hypothetical protein RIC87_20345 [Kiloniellales bacterium]
MKTIGYLKASLAGAAILAIAGAAGSAQADGELEDGRARGGIRAGLQRRRTRGLRVMPTRALWVLAAVLVILIAASGCKATYWNTPQKACNTCVGPYDITLRSHKAVVEE